MNDLTNSFSYLLDFLAQLIQLIVLSLKHFLSLAFVTSHIFFSYSLIAFQLSVVVVVAVLISVYSLNVEAL